MLLTLMLLAAAQTSQCLAPDRRTYRPVVFGGGGRGLGGAVGKLSRLGLRREGGGGRLYKPRQAAAGIAH